MDDYVLRVVGVVVVTAIAVIHLVGRAKRSCPAPANLPPGSLGLPVIGQTLSIIRALMANRFEQWTTDRINRYGLVSKLSLFGTPTVLLSGPEANKFILFSSALQVRHIETFHRVVGERSIHHLHGDDHRRIRRALVEFLKPEQLVGRVDAQVRLHLEEKWYGRTTVTVQPLMKRLTFDIITSLLLGMEAGHTRDAFAEDFRRLVEDMFVIPVSLPFTAFSRRLKACQRSRKLLEGITRDKKAKLGRGSSNKDLISRLLSLTDGHGDRLVTDEEIVDNSMLALIAGHDTTSVLMTFMIRHLANDPVNLAAMVQEHEEIAKNKSHGEALSGEDLSKMKFTWRVAQETLRIVPPAMGILRRAHENVEFDGYCIPKGWQVFAASNATHMDPNIFDEPAMFDPSRFEKPTPPFSFLGFGGGPRTCPGMDLAKTVTLVTMHYLVRHVRWKLCCKDNTFSWDPFPSMLRGLPIKLEHKTSI